MPVILVPAWWLQKQAQSLPPLGYSEENFSDEVFEDLIHVIQRLVRVGEKYQIMVGIEAGLNHPLYSNQRIAELIERVPSDYLGIIYDPTNLITAKRLLIKSHCGRRKHLLFRRENRLLSPKGFSTLGRRSDPCPV